MIYTIGYLRGIAALLVMLFHFRDYLNNVYAQSDFGTLLFGSGSVGVDIFFVISGFIIVYSTRNKESNGVIKFAVRRIFRIYPLLIFSVVVFSWIPPEIFSMKDIFRAIIPLNQNYSDAAPYFGFNLYMPAWTLTYEVMFYAIFLFSLLVSHKYRVVISSAAIFLMVFGLQYILNGGVTLDAHHSAILAYPFINQLMSPMLLEFVFGMLLASAYGRVKEFKSNTALKATTFYLLFCIGIFLTMWFSKFREGAGPINYGLWAAVIVPAALLYEKCFAINPNKLLLFFGDISYSLYMVHIIVPFFLGYKAFWDPFYLDLNGVAKLIYVSTWCIASAYLLHICIEKPMIKMSKKLLSQI